MPGIIQQLADLTIAPTPSSGRYLLSIDLDGILKYKTPDGTIIPVGQGAGQWTDEDVKDRIIEIVNQLNS